MDKWRRMGYRIALWRDGSMKSRETGEVVLEPLVMQDVHGQIPSLPSADLVVSAPVYPGYARAVNTLAAQVFVTDKGCDWMVTGGDDTDPDFDKTADEIARECSAHFAGTFGVMQPTGDRWADSLGVIIERIAGSPWFGREWCLRANQGKGPIWPEFDHMFEDEFVRAYAMHLGVYRERPDLIHFHDHAQRKTDSAGHQIAGHAGPAPHMAKWNTREHWDKSRAIFERLKAGNFRECAPL